MGKVTNLQKCLEVAWALYTPNVRKGRHMAFLLDHKGKILSIGQNSPVMHPRQNIFGYPSFSGEHAEFACLRKLSFRIPKENKLTLVSIRIDRNKKLNHAAPCKHCTAVLKRFNVRNIVYSDWSGDMVNLTLRT